MRRRTFLLAGLGAGGAFILGWSLLPTRQRRVGARPMPVNDREVALNGWVKIAPDDTVTIIMAKSEMGQGIHTALAMILAEELDCDWSRVRVEHSPIDRIYNNVSAIVELAVQGVRERKQLVFSGDLGRYGRPVMPE